MNITNTLSIHNSEASTTQNNKQISDQHSCAFTIEYLQLTHSFQTSHAWTLKLKSICQKKVYQLRRDASNIDCKTVTSKWPNIHINRNSLGTNFFL